MVSSAALSQQTHTTQSLSHTAHLHATDHLRDRHGESAGPCWRLEKNGRTGWLEMIDLTLLLRNFACFRKLEEVWLQQKRQETPGGAAAKLEQWKIGNVLLGLLILHFSFESVTRVSAGIRLVEIFSWSTSYYRLSNIQIPRST